MYNQHHHQMYRDVETGPRLIAQVWIGSRRGIGGTGNARGRFGERPVHGPVECALWRILPKI